MGTRILGVLAILSLAACGDGIDDVPGGPDARVVFDATIADALAIPDAGTADAGASPCGATGTYVEADDANNDAIHGGIIEASGIALTGGNRSVGGCIDPQYTDTTTPEVADADVYSVTLGAANFVSGRIFSAQGAAADGGIVILVNGNSDVVTSAELVDGEALLPPVHLPAGQYLVVVYHPDTALAAVYSYGVELRTYACSTQTEAPNYSENKDGVFNRGNDMFAVDWDNQFVGFTLTATATPSDVAEGASTLIIAGHDNRRRFDGSSADLASDGDDYLDRDTYLFRTSGNIRRVLAVVDWIGAGNDLDFMILPEGQIDEAAVAGVGRTTGGSLDRAGALVTPSSRYWIWVGDRNTSNPPTSGLAYRVTLCGYP